MMFLHASMSEPTVDDRSTEFKAVDGETGEQFSGYRLMVEAYAAVWLVMMVWLFFLWRKQADLSSRITGLETALTRAEKKLGAAKTAKPSASEASTEPQET